MQLLSVAIGDCTSSPVSPLGGLKGDNDEKRETGYQQLTKDLLKFTSGSQSGGDGVASFNTATRQTAVSSRGQKKNSKTEERGRWGQSEKDIKTNREIYRYREKMIGDRRFPHLHSIITRTPRGLIVCSMASAT